MQINGTELKSLCGILFFGSRQQALTYKREHWHKKIQQEKTKIKGEMSEISNAQNLRTTDMAQEWRVPINARNDDNW